MKHYRNKIDIISFEGIFVEVESLWIRKGELMVLVDDDQYASFPYSETKFYPVNLEIH